MAMTREERNAYNRRHARRIKFYGRASAHPCSHCAERGIDKAARDWATIHGTDGENPHTDYIALCKKCHHAYDGYGHHTPHTDETRALLSQKNRGYQHTPEAVEKIRAAARNPSAEARAKMAAGGRKSGATRRAQPMSAEQRAQISATLKGNSNASGTGRRSGQALENIRRGQQERRRREQEARSAGQESGTLSPDARAS